MADASQLGDGPCDPGDLVLFEHLECRLSIRPRGADVKIHYNASRNSTNVYLAVKKNSMDVKFVTGCPWRKSKGCNLQVARRPSGAQSWQNHAKSTISGEEVERHPPWITMIWGWWCRSSQRARPCDGKLVHEEKVTFSRLTHRLKSMDSGWRMTHGPLKNLLNLVERREFYQVTMTKGALPAPVKFTQRWCFYGFQLIPSHKSV